MMWKHFLIRASHDGATEGGDVYQGHLDLDLDVPAQEGVLECAPPEERGRGDSKM